MLCISAYAQTSNADKLMFRAGIMQAYFSAVDDTVPTTQYVNQGYRALAFETYYILNQKNDIMSFGALGGISGSLRPQGQSLGKFRASGQVSVPVYAAFRLGAQSTPYNRQKVGIGAGLGAMYAHTSTFYGTYSAQLSYVSPQAMAEVILNMRAAMLTLRFHMSPLSTKTNTVLVDARTSEKIKLPSKVSNFGFGIVYSF